MDLRSLKPCRDYSDIAPQVVACYQEIDNIAMVAERYHLAKSTVARLLREAGVKIKHGGTAMKTYKGRPVEKPVDADCCYYCRAYSRTSVIAGWCMTHRRPVRSNNKEPCFR